MHWLHEPAKWTTEGDSIVVTADPLIRFQGEKAAGDNYRRQRVTISMADHEDDSYQIGGVRGNRRRARPHSARRARRMP